MDAAYGPWWKPLGKEAIDNDLFWTRSPTVGPMPEKPWRIGEAKPAGSLALGSSASAVTVGLLSFASLALALHAPAVPLINLSDQPWWITMGAIYGLQSIPLALGAMVESIGSSSRKLSGLGRTGEIGVAKLFQGWLNTASSLILIPELPIHSIFSLASQKLSGKKSNTMGSSSKSWSLGNFSYRVETLSKAYQHRADLLAEQGVSDLTEVGAWRLARDHISNDCPEKAARVWFARPFNPEWSVSARTESNSKLKSFFGTGMSFAKCIALEADNISRRHPEKSNYLKTCVVAMSAAHDKIALSGIIPATPTPPSTSSGPKKSRL